MLNHADRVLVSVSKIYDRMGALHLNMTQLSALTNTNMWSITKSGRTVKTTAYEIAEALQCKPSDIIIGVPEETKVLGSVVYGPECYEMGPCFGRSDKGRCQILARGYEKGRRCPFRKEKRSGKRPCAN